MTPIREHQLPNGLRIAIFDETNRYFGDYHRVCLRIVICYDLTVAAAREDGSFWADALARLGGEFRVEKKLEKMGVAGEQVEANVAAMAEDFLATADEYLAGPDALRKLIEREMEKRRKTVRIH